MRRTVLYAGLALSALCLAPNIAAQSTDLLPTTSYTLLNGLRVVIGEERSSPNVAVELWVRAGTRYEDAGHWGQAHFFEHMLGATRVPPLPGRVLDGNAQTRRDFCRYYLMVGAESLEYALALEADQLDFPVAAMNESRLGANRDIVINEYRGNESRPYGFGSATDVKLLVNGFGPQHPYGRPIQLNGDISRLQPEDMQLWLASHYVPSESILLIVGNVTPDWVQPLVKRYFEPIPPAKDLIVGPRSRVTREQVHPTVERHERMDLAAPASRLFAAWATPAYGSPDADYLTLFDDILAAPEFGRLYRRLVLEEKLAATTAADAQLEELAGLIRATVDLRPGVDVQKAEASMLETLTELLRTGPTPEELAMAKTLQRTRFARQLEQLGFQNSCIDLLGEGALFTGGPATYRQRQNRIAAATPADVARVLHSWVQGHGYFLTAVATVKAEATTPIDRTQPVSLPPLSPPTPPPAELKVLRNGITLVTVPRPQSLLTNITLIAPPTNPSETADHRLAYARAVMDRDVSNQSSRARAWRACISQGCYTDVTADALGTVVSIEGLSPASAAALHAAASFFNSERLDAGALQRAARNPRDRASLDPATQARNALMELLASREPAGAKSAPPSKLTPFSSQRATLIVTGRFDRTTIEAVLERDFRASDAPDAPAPATVTEPSPVLKPGVHIIDAPGRAQTVIATGHRLPPITIDSWVTAHLAAELASARANTNLREQHHWAYGAQASLINTVDGAPAIVISTEVQADKTAEAIAEIRRELEAPVRPADVARLALYRRDLIRQLASGGAISRIAATFAHLTRTGIPATGLPTVLGHAQGVDGTSLHDAVGLLQQNSPMFVLVGDLKQIRSQIQAIGLDVSEMLGERLR